MAMRKVNTFTSSFDNTNYVIRKCGMEMKIFIFSLGKSFIFVISL